MFLIVNAVGCFSFSIDWSGSITDIPQRIGTDLDDE